MGLEYMVICDQLEEGRTGYGLMVWMANSCGCSGICAAGRSRYWIWPGGAIWDGCVRNISGKLWRIFWRHGENRQVPESEKACSDAVSGDWKKNIQFLIKNLKKGVDREGIS